MPAALVERHLPDAVAVLGQTDMDAARIAAAPQLRAIVNVEGNLLPNVDYDACFARGIHVLVASPAFAPAGRRGGAGHGDRPRAAGSRAADRAMRAGTEVYGLDANRDAFLLQGADVGVIGFGASAAAARLLAPFGCRVRAHDPWQPTGRLRARAPSRAALDELLRASRVVFVFAAATSDNEAMLGARELDLLPGGAFVCWPAGPRWPTSTRWWSARPRGRLRAAIDVWPEEPLAAAHPARAREGLLLCAHRTGGMPEAFRRSASWRSADLELVLRGLPPVLCARAERETVGRLRSRPVARS